MRESNYQGRMSDRGMNAGQGGQSRGNPMNLGSARSDYGEYAYGGRLNEQGMERGWMDRTSDEVSSWFGDEDAERRRMMDRSGGGSSGTRGRRQYYAGPRNMMSSRGYEGRSDWQNMRAGDVMTREVATVFPNDLVRYATRIMRDEDCGALPVVDSYGRMIGMITDRDVAVRLVADGYDASRAIVADCMTDEVFACHVNDSLRECMDVMSRHQIRRLPILNDRDQVIGIVSQGDLSLHAAESRAREERQAFTETMGAVSEPSGSAYR